MPEMPDGNFTLALVLSGGNALGAYQAGAYEALHEAGMEPEWIAGASIGSVNGAIICGSPHDRRIANLDALWNADRGRRAHGDQGSRTLESARRTGAAAFTLAAGRPGMFVPRNLFGPWWNPFANPEPRSLYDSSPVVATMEQLVDFDLLNSGAPRFSATAVDIETGEDICFDTRTHRIEANHLRASSALLPAFSPVEIGGRIVGDGGLSANLPLDVVLGETAPRPLLCIAVDLLPLRGSRPATLGETASRMQDLVFAAQSRRTISAWQAIFDERIRDGSARSVTILHIAYTDQSREVSGKAFDFSPRSAAARWRVGRQDLCSALAELRSGNLAVGQPGLSVHVQNGSRHLEQVRGALGPIQG
ncbi:MAG: patatin [Sphingomonadales bacterium]|nr:patatin [Sphingomonadales bacterium]